MKFSTIVCAALCGVASASPFVPRQNAATPEQIAALAVDLGAFPNTNPNPFGDCDGPAQPGGNIPKVPCSCPPLRDAYIQALTTNVQAGFAVNNTNVRVTFPTGDSVQDKKGRITAAVITLQNLKAAGVGCPGVSTTFAQQSRNLDTCGDFLCGDAPAATTPPPAATTPPPAAVTQAPAPVDTGASSTVTVTVQTVVTSTVTVTRDGATPTPQAPAQVIANPPAEPTEAVDNGNNGVLSRELVDSLAPELGSQPNNNPNQFGDCDGPRQPDGKIARVPCACPPVREEFIDQLLANIQAGRAVRNPSVTLSFPTGNSPQDQRARITAATITLQNLNGPGQGCPNVSTTFKAQSDAIGN